MSARASEIALTHSLLDTHPQSPVVNSQTPGIGRLAGIDNLLIVNNLGRNLEVCRDDGGILKQLAVFEETIFPDQDDTSQFDLDMHAFIRTADGAYLVAINHHGLVRFFNWPAADNQRLLKLAFSLKWPGDAERIIAVQRTLISSSPAGYEVDDPPQPGVLISDPWPVSGADFAAPALAYRAELKDWGLVNNVAADARGAYLFVAAGKHAGIFELQFSGNSVRIGNQILEVETEFRIGWAQFTDDSNYIAIAGYESAGAGEQDWDWLRGGGFKILDLESCRPVAGGKFDADLAWGNGSVPLVLMNDCLFGVDRSAALYRWNLANGKGQMVAKPPQSGVNSLGMAHFARCGDTLYSGFNRGGYKLHRYA